MAKKPTKSRKLKGVTPQRAARLEKMGFGDKLPDAPADAPKTRTTIVGGRARQVPVD